jgi:YtkA-like
MGLLMPKVSLWRAGACAAVSMLAGGGAASAGGGDYRFEAVSPTVHNGAGSELAVRIVHIPTGRVIGDAVLFRTRLDMSPDDMADMVAPLKPIPADTASAAAAYRFKADLSMAGRWAFKVMAKVPGERDTVQGTVIFTAD